MQNLFTSLNIFQAAPAAGGSTGQLLSTVIMFAAVFGIFYFMIIRPQKKREKAMQAMINAVKKGDSIVTIGGIHGTVSSVKEKSVIVKVDDSSKIEFSKSAIATVEPRGGDDAKTVTDVKAKPVVEAKAEEVKSSEAKIEDNKEASK